MKGECKYEEKAGMVMTSGNTDPMEWHEIIGNKRHRGEMAMRAVLRLIMSALLPRCNTISNY